ncbi:hypothetical protein AKJ52_03000, partial [candidate division MSBL1 archaeon SCGC-AAA382C18]
EDVVNYLNDRREEVSNRTLFDDTQVIKQFLDDLGKLLEYHMEQEEIEDRNVKGVLIANHNRKTKPEERNSVATEGALEIAKKHDFCILSTEILYYILEDYWKDEISKEEFLGLIQNTTGIANYQRGK